MSFDIDHINSSKHQSSHNSGVAGARLGMASSAESAIYNVVLVPV